jgi:phosphatidylglycerophosphate synthase
MKLANKITIARICLIPVFGIFARQYGARVVRGRPAEYVRVIAAFVFILAAAMDGLDGFLLAVSTNAAASERFWIRLPTKA